MRHDAGAMSNSGTGATASTKLTLPEIFQPKNRQRTTIIRIEILVQASSSTPNHLSLLFLKFKTYNMGLWCGEEPSLSLCPPEVKALICEWLIPRRWENEDTGVWADLSSICNLRLVTKEWAEVGAPFLFADRDFTIVPHRNSVERLIKLSECP